jgi:hypothetical protein
MDKRPTVHRYQRHRQVLLALLALLLALGVAPIAPAPVAAAPAAQSPLASWTFLIYLDGDNNLERDAIDDWLEMATVGSNADVNVIVQFDRAPGYDRRYGDWTGTLRYRVEQGMTPEPAAALADLGEANMGDPQTLIDFVTWGMAAYPAERTALVLWNHGDGWRTSSFLKVRRKAVCFDDTADGDALDLAELRQAMAAVTQEGAAPLDLLAFDACLMGMLEIDAQLQPYVQVRTASEETEPGTGYPFDAILAEVRSHPAWDAASLGRAIVAQYYEAYEGETHSAVDLGDGLSILMAAVDDLARALLAHADTEFSVVHDVRLQTQQFQGHYVDLYDLAERLAAASAEDAVRATAQEVMASLEPAVLHELHGPYWPGAHGISIYFPAQPSGWDSAYSGENDYLLFTAQTQWDDFLLAYLAGAASCEPDVYEPDDEPAAAAAIDVGGKPQAHNFCPATDAADWASFQAQAGVTYEIATSELDVFCDTVLELVAADGETVLAQDDDSGAGWASRILWTAPATGVYYARVGEYFGRTGQDTGYLLGVSTSSLSARGQVFLQGRAPDGNRLGGTAIAVHLAEIASLDSAPVYSTTTAADGTFAVAAALPCTVTARHAGYLPGRWSLTEAAGPELTLEPLTLLGGDVNGDEGIDILDIVYIAARFGGTDPRADVNEDGQVNILDLTVTAGNFGRSYDG